MHVFWNLQFGAEKIRFIISLREILADKIDTPRIFSAAPTPYGFFMKKSSSSFVLFKFYDASSEAVNEVSQK